MKTLEDEQIYLDKLTELNNEIINMQRDLAKKNAQISELLQKTEKINNNLDMANQMKDRIFSIIGHDLRGLMANINTCVSMITVSEESYQNLKDKDVFTKLGSSAENAMLLLENLMKWAKSNMGELTFNPLPFQLSEVVKSEINLLWVIAQQKQIEIIWECEGDILVCADSRMIGTIIRNLVSNGIKFTKEGGTVSIYCTRLENFAEVKVVDSGVGIPEEKIGEIFNEYKGSSVKGTNGEIGTGFGLLLCKRLIEQQGGTIGISSEIGKGTELIFTIPLAVEE